MKKLGLILLSTILFFFSIGADSPLAIKAKKVVTVSGKTFDNGIILIKDKKIQQVGTDILIPAEYKILDYAQSFVYPGLINPMTSIGLSGISSAREWSDYRERGKYNPEISTFSAFYPWGNLVANNRDFGTLIVLAAPTGGTISGKGTLANLFGWVPEDMFLKKEAALIINLPESPRRRRSQPEQKKKDFSKEKKELKSFIVAARNYHLRSIKGQLSDYNPKYDAMSDLWSKKLPVILRANTDKDIKFAIELGKETGLKVILYSIYDGEKVLKEIKESGFPVILSSMYTANREWEDGYDKVFRLPALLAKKGIKFAFSTYFAATAFDLPIQAARSVAYGLSREDALKALTLYPAEILGLNQYGAIESGKVANLIVTDGCILSTATKVKDVFIMGKKVEAKSFFRREYERAKNKISGELK
jgi:imidazolonepropionase-like amidohydrolase